MPLSRQTTIMLDFLKHQSVVKKPPENPPKYLTCEAKGAFADVLWWS